MGAAIGVLLAGCGGREQVDRDGFSASDRKNAQDVLARLARTSIPTALVTMTNTAAAAPDRCLVHLLSREEKTFRLFVFWSPYDPKYTDATYTWLEGTIGPDVLQDAFHLSHSGPRTPTVRALEAGRGDVFAKPVARCQVTANGHLRLLPAE